MSFKEIEEAVSELDFEVKDMEKLYENLDKAFCRGTIFEELDKPFTGRRCVR